jgi:hypothetical protein
LESAPLHKESDKRCDYAAAYGPKHDETPTVSASR